MAVGQGSNTTVNTSEEGMLRSADTMQQYSDLFKNLQGQVGSNWSSAAAQNGGEFVTIFGQGMTNWGQQFQSVINSLIGLEANLRSTAQKYAASHSDNQQTAQQYANAMPDVQLPNFQV